MSDKAPERIWIDAAGGRWSPVAGGTQGVEYVRSDVLAAVQVTVKPLAWEEVEDARGDGRSEYNGGYAADSPLGVYEIAIGFGSDSYYWSVSDPLLNEVGSYEDPSYAKAAAQADYEARILAALELTPPTAQDAARVPEIAALIEKSEVLRDDVTGRVDAFGDRIGIAQPMIGFGAKQWADFVAALRAIAEGK